MNFGRMLDRKEFKKFSVRASEEESWCSDKRECK